MITQEELTDMRLTANNLRKTDMGNASTYIDKLFAHIDEQASQIATLKEAFITEKAMSLHWYEQAHEGRTNDWEEYSSTDKESRLWYAEHRLARELPEIFQEDRT